MTAAAIQASFADWKLVKTRAVVQLIFEIPVEQSDLAYKVVGGMPDAAKERWFAIARLQENGVRTPSREAGHEMGQEPVPHSPASRSFNELPMPQQAGILCNEVAFHKYLGEFHSQDWRDFQSMPDPVQAATFCVRRLCGGIASRRELMPDTPEGEKWKELVSLYRAWMREPEFVA